MRGIDDAETSVKRFIKSSACNGSLTARSRQLGLLVLLLAIVLSSGCDDVARPPLADEQHVVLDGTPNFRDLGGYVTRSGHRVKTGMLYRSGSLAGLTDADLKRVAQLKLRTVYDFRTSDEVEAAPDRLPPDADMNIVALPIGDPGVNVEELRMRIYAGDIAGLRLPDSYAGLALEKSDVYRAWFDDLLDPARIPGVFHCTAGKDRTGVGAALFLYALGVPRETVMQDYLASNYYLHDATERIVWKARLASRFRVDGDQLRTLLGVQAASMENAFKAIEASYGSLDAYLEQALGLDAAKLARLRELYLD